jgi:hypothetical protein
MLDGDEVMRERLTCSQILIVSKSMASTRSIPAIRSLRVGGWDSVNRSVPICWSVVTAFPSMTRHATGVVDVTSIEPRQRLMGLARMSIMLLGKMTPLVEAIELHEEPRLSPTWCANCQMVRSRQPMGVLTPVV